MPPPPIGSRRPTEEIGILHSAIAEITLHLREVSEELATERKVRQEEKEKGISILRLQVPFLLWFVTVGGLVTAGISAGMFVNSTKAHIADTSHLHADPVAVLARGGLAYQRDVDSKVADAVSEIEKGDREALRVIVKSSPLICTSNGRGRPPACKFAEAISPR